MFWMIFIYSVICYGLCNIVIYANGPFHIFKKMHEWLKPRYPVLEEMLSCMICLPTWCGAVMSVLNLLFFPLNPFTPANLLIGSSMWYVTVFLDMMFTSGMVWLIHTLQEMMERIEAE